MKNYATREEAYARLDELVGAPDGPPGMAREALALLLRGRPDLVTADRVALGRALTIALYEASFAPTERGRSAVVVDSMSELAKVRNPETLLRILGDAMALLFPQTHTLEPELQRRGWAAERA